MGCLNRGRMQQQQQVGWSGYLGAREGRCEGVLERDMNSNLSALTIIIYVEYFDCVIFERFNILIKQRHMA